MLGIWRRSLSDQLILWHSGHPPLLVRAKFGYTPINKLKDIRKTYLVWIKWQRDLLSFLFVCLCFKVFFKVRVLMPHQYCDQIVVLSGPTFVVENTTLTTVAGLVVPCSGEEFSDWPGSSPILPSASSSLFSSPKSTQYNHTVISKANIYPWYMIHDSKNRFNLSFSTCYLVHCPKTYTGTSQTGYAQNNPQRSSKILIIHELWPLQIKVYRLSNLHTVLLTWRKWWSSTCAAQSQRLFLSPVPLGRSVRRTSQRILDPPPPPSRWKKDWCNLSPFALGKHGAAVSAASSKNSIGCTLILNPTLNVYIL